VHFPVANHQAAGHVLPLPKKGGQSYPKPCQHTRNGTIPETVEKRYRDSQYKATTGEKAAFIFNK
jgi:hypothetical protein